MGGQPFVAKVTDTNVIGIDLGTTNSVVAFIKNQVPFVISNEFGKPTTPSVVHLGEPEAVGEEALKFLEKDPANTIFASKRLIGRKFKDPEIQEYIKMLPYKTQSVCNGDIWIKSSDLGKFSPAQIGAKVLSKLKELGEKYLGQPIQRAVVTVPAYFDDSQRQATKQAGKLAKLDVIRIINEPTAAALAYGLNKKEAGHIAVYDLGGGTFDISILELDNGIFHVKSTNGDTFLGGEDFDNELVKFLSRSFEQDEGVSIEDDPKAMLKLKAAAESAKRELSEKTATRVFVDNIIDGYDLDMELKRDQLESVVKRIAQRTIVPCEQAMRDAKINREDIKHVILVGGMTKMPYIRQLVREIFAKEPYTNIDPDEAVAKGAAIQAGVLSGAIGDVLLLDVAPLSLGIEVLGGMFSRIVDRNTTIPFKHTETFSTSEDNQNEVDIKIFQGERPMVSDNRFLGSLKLKNIGSAPRGEPKINVTFEADANGIIKVTAEDGAIKEAHTVELSQNSGLTEDEVERMLREAEEKREQDKEREKMAKFKLDSREFIANIKALKLPADIQQKFAQLTTLLDGGSFPVDQAERLLLELKKHV